MQAKRRSGINPLAYLGVDPITPPMLIVEQRDPTNNDYSEYELGALWMVSIPTKIWMMVSKDPDPSITKWVQIYPGDGSGTNFFKTDDGNTAVQVGGLLNVYGTNDVATYSSGNTVTVGLENDVRIVNSLAITPITSSVLATESHGVIYGIQGADKQFFMWETAGGPGFHSATSDDGTVNIEWSTLVPGAISFTAIGGGGGGFGGLIDQLGNTAVPALNKVTTIGDATNITTSASGSTLTITLADVITLPRTNAVGSQGIIKLGTSPFISNYGTDNTFLGEAAGNYTLTAALSTGNTAVGTGAMNDLTSSPNNTGVGVGSLTAVAGGTGANTAIGALSGATIVDGHNNVCIGSEAGTNYTSESNNIVISNDGVALDSGVIRIGIQGTHVHNYQGGIYNAGIGATSGIVVVDDTGKLGSSNGAVGQVMIGGGTGPVWANFTSSDSSIIFTPGDNQLDMVAVGGGGSSGVIKLGADVGTPALPLLGEIDIYGGTNINTQTAPNAVVVNLDDWISLPSTNSAGTAGGLSLNSIRFMHGIGTNNTFLGPNAGNLASSTGSTDNTGIGYKAMYALVYGDYNVAVGSNALKSMVGGSTVGAGNDGNTVIGYNSGTLLNATSGGPGSRADYNTLLGFQALSRATTAAGNICIGSNSGYNYTTSESSNILIGNQGVAGESNKIRIGTSGLSAGATYIANINDGTTERFVTCQSGLLQAADLDLQSTTFGDIIYTTKNGSGTNYSTWGPLHSSDGSIVVTPGNYLSPGIDIKADPYATIGFQAKLSANMPNATGDGTTVALGALAVFTENFDLGNDFYPGSGAGARAYFTAPKDGLYFFQVTVYIYNILSTMVRTVVDPITIQINHLGSPTYYQLINPVIAYPPAGSPANDQTLFFTQIVKMYAADTAYFSFSLTTSLGTKTVGIGSLYTTLGGFYIS